MVGSRSCTGLARVLVATLFGAGSMLAGCSSESSTAPTVADTGGDANADSDEEDADDDAGRDASGDTNGGGDAGKTDAPSDAPKTDAGPTDAGRPTCTGEEPEPNGSVPSARPLPAIDDCDGSGATLKGVLANATDVDYWTYHGTDKFGCVVDPTASTTSKVRVCVYPSCFGGQTEFKSCKKGTEADPVAGGIKGCCSDASGNVEAEFGCPLVGSSDEADVFVKVDAPNATQCLAYEVAYHF